MAYSIDYPLSVSPHGGGCCGISHLHEFPSGGNSTTGQRIAYIEEGVQDVIDDNISEVDEDDHPGVDEDNFRHCAQVVITASQRTDWDKALTEVGFKEVFSFKNSKSGNRCFVYLLETNRPESEK